MGNISQLCLVEDNDILSKAKVANVSRVAEVRQQQTACNQLNLRIENKHYLFDPIEEELTPSHDAMFAVEITVLAAAVRAIFSDMRSGEEGQYLPWTVVILSSPSGRTTASDRS